jgi:DNA-binding LacI/PurR family transcriptional regulator
VVATIRDVAEKAEVSIATVSRVVNQNPAVSDATRQKVLDAISVLNYTPSQIARRLSLGRTQTVAVVLPSFFTRPSYVERLRGIQDVLTKSEYDLVIHTVDSPVQIEGYFTTLSHPSRVDGVLFISLPPTKEYVEQYLPTGAPAVLVDGNHEQFSRVMIDDRHGGRLVTEHLVKLGHRRIAFLSDFLNTPYYISMQLRFEGYREVLKTAGIPFRPEYHVEGAHARLEARELARQLLSLDDPPTAIFAASDTQAIGVLDAARSMGMRLPEDLSLVGFDNIRDAEYLNLTTVHQPLYESGVQGAQILLSMMKNPAKPIQVVTQELSLIIRSTTGPVPETGVSS